MKWTYLPPQCRLRFLAAISVVLSVLLLNSPKNISAAAITWSSGAFDSDLDVENIGSTIEALMFNGEEAVNALGGTARITTNVAVNGVTFAPLSFSSSGFLTNLTGLNYDRGQFGHTTATTGFGTIIAGIGFQSGFGSHTTTLTGLSVGQEYLVQAFYYHNALNRGLTLGDGGGSNITINDTSNSGVGVFATGTFTADATTQTLELQASTGSQYLNGYQLRAVPEPSTFSMMAFCGLAMAGYSRLRRRRK